MDPRQQPQQQNPQQQQGYQQQPYPPNSQQPYSQQPYPQQVDGYQPAQGNKGLNVRMMLIVGGTFLGLVITILIASTILGGGSSNENPQTAESALALESFSDISIPFTVEVPSGWTTQAYEQEDYASISAIPGDAGDQDATSLTIGFNAVESTPEQLISEAQIRQDQFDSSDFVSTRGYSASSVSVENYGTTDSPAFRTFYTRTAGSEVAQVEEYLIFRPENNTVVYATFTYTENYSELKDSITAILQSFSVND